MRALFALLLFSAAAFAQGVKITWVGQACFLVEGDPTGPVVMTDPPVASVGYALPTKAADVVTVSHNHTDHNNVAGVRGTPAVADGRPITARQEMTAAGLPFVLIPGSHGTGRGQNTIVHWTQAGIRFAHFGDYGQDALTAEQLADLNGVDVVFLPGGGFFTIEPAKTAELIGQLRPRVAILMHLRTGIGGPAQLATFPAVTAPYPDIRYKPSTVALTRATLPQTTEVWLMEVDAELVAVNAAGFTRGMPVAGGSLVSVFGNFTGAGSQAAQAVPLPRALGNVEVLVGTRAAPLHFVSPEQINVQVPTGLDNSYQALEVRVGGQRVSRGSVAILPRAPGLFLAFNQNGTLNATSAPARRGELLQIFATGQGPVDPALEDGAAGAASPLSLTREQPAVYIGGKLATLQYSGLTPGATGVWQINAFIPGDTPTGSSVGVVVVHGLTSNELRVTIE